MSETSKLREEIAGGLVCVLLALAVNAYLHESRVYQFLEEITYDEWIKANPIETTNYIQIIAIDDDSYEQYFGNKSPLAPGTIQKLIAIALGGGAAVVGVDLDTSDWSPNDWRKVPLERTVWTASDSAPKDAKAGSAGLAPSSVHDWQRRNETGIIRTHANPGHRPVFSELIAEELRRRTQAYVNDSIGFLPNPTQVGEGAYIRFVRQTQPDKRETANGIQSQTSKPNFLTYPAHRLLKETKPLPKDLFRNAAVLIGGTAAKLGDVHETPFGLQSGVDIHAESLYSLIRGPVRPLPEWLVLTIDLLLGAGFVCAAAKLDSSIKKFVLLAGLLILTFAASFIWLRWSAIFLGATTVTLGVILHELFELVQFRWNHRNCQMENGEDSSSGSTEQSKADHAALLFAVFRRRAP